MSLLWPAYSLLSQFNTLLLRLGRFVSWIALALMVVVILLQVTFRYVFNAPLPWPEEAARFLMLWMTGLSAPSAFRWGGFVAIDMVPRALKGRSGEVLNLFLLLICMTVISVAVQLGWTNVGSGWLFNSSSLKIPLDWVGGETIRIKLAWMYMSLAVCFSLLALINVELILKSVMLLIDPKKDIPDDPDLITAGGD